jgi:hypothetical protein
MADFREWIVYVPARWFHGWREFARFPSRGLALACAQRLKLRSYRIALFRG